MYKLNKETPKFISYNFFINTEMDRRALDIFKKAIDGKNLTISYSDSKSAKVRTFVADEEEIAKCIVTVKIGYIALGITKSEQGDEGMRRLIDDIVHDIQSGDL